MADVLKKTTGLVGLAVCNTPHERLRILYTKILDVLEDIPRNAAYRKYTEQIINEKLAMVKEEPDVQKLEDQLQVTQIISKVFL
uniref:NADH dehydrogenase [ubiquinone] 1 alpha subcomplex subunit 5 n=1 Tax=Callithrix jacchus TaxID=9483 RepID=H9KXS8_CALJA